MLAAKLFGANDIRLVECEKPSIGEGDILLKTSAAAICGSDLRMIAHGRRGVDERHPLTLGHEISGVVTEIGSRARGFAAGMRVSVAPNFGCGICGRCVRGDTHLCPDYRALGIHLDGGFAEYVRIPEQAIAQGNLMVLDDSVSMEAAAIFEPMSCVLNGQSRVNPGLNDTVLIIGAGPIGVMHAILAEAGGASRILLYDLSRERVRKGAEICPGIAPVYDDLAGTVAKLTKGRGVDVCITACSSGAVQAEALELAATNGRVLFFAGLPEGSEAVRLPTNLIHYRQLGIFGSTRSNVSQYRAVAEAAAAGRLDLSRLVTAEYGLKEFSRAVEYAKSATGLKTVITFQ